ncbi:hypothetical protein AUR64_09785 [Haloprofundus marisrubri]|uniref:ABC transporter permease n=1 Tax=Haloprofundus marisrubri TaxID=1514971 RepID=A0A0W1RA06_9EURY|nr:hypothetical protein [Haloprofundus marisrubri]KTG09906.1 hypothetical protein AUR64_09785 [Haloprofundus marisrubri]
MTDTLGKLEFRLLTSNWQSWNHPLRAKLLFLALIVGGGVASILLQIELEHLGYSALPGELTTAVFCLGFPSFGLVVLALVD